MRTRILLGAVGVLGMLWGIRLIFVNTGVSKPKDLAEWLIAAVIIHDGILVPATMTLGALITLTVKPRARRYVQGALVAMALVTVVAIPLIYRKGDQQASLALLQQDYKAHLAILLAIIAFVAAMAYAIRVFLDRRQRTSDMKVRPPASQTSATP